MASECIKAHANTRSTALNAGGGGGGGGGGAFGSLP